MKNKFRSGQVRTNLGVAGASPLYCEISCLTNTVPCFYCTKI